jgi:aminopeptidase N
MLRATIGDEKFFNLLKTYYATFKGQNASIDDFESLANKAAGSNLRGFFALWVDSTGVPEFKVDYSIIRTKEGQFKIRGTVRQNLDSFRGPVSIAVESEGGREAKTTLDMRGTAADFELATEGKPLDVIVDPENRYLRTSDALKTAVVVRRGIQHMEREEYAEADPEAARVDWKQAPAGGRGQAVALEFEKGRVVVFGNAAALTAQIGSKDIHYGMNVSGFGNRQLALNIMHWLSRLLK